MNDDTDGTAAPNDLSPTQSFAGEGPVSSRIGPFRILQKLGEGGMGEVYEAEQEKPVRRKVALKLIKAGMDTKQVVARFESERQALALMNHPGIARVYDAGSTELGRPYFAMELVRGEPITAYCDRHRLPTTERLHLFIQVCDGVQHAHQKGVIHRDLKPSNVLVSIQDDRPVPKIIDFGVAKATGQRLTEKTMFTQMGVMVGTPEYMSPEQAEMTGLDVDTRTDVYSLGVILYQLLVGALPFDTKDLRAASFDEIRRRIREEDPSKPSTRLSTLGDASTESARRRRCDPPTLRRLLSGDLDWITMKALEKDRTRRYPSPGDLAADIGRHLKDEPVLAGPPSRTYRLKKFVRRNKIAVAAAAVVVTAMLLGLAGTTFGLLRAMRAQEQARQEAATAEKVTEFLVGMFETSRPDQSLGRSVTVREVLDRSAKTIDSELADEPLVRSRLMLAMGRVYLGLSLLDDADPLLTTSYETRASMSGPDDRSTLSAGASLAWLRYRQGRFDEAEPLMLDTLASRRRLMGDDDPATLWSMHALGQWYQENGRLQEAEPLIDEVLRRRRQMLGEDHLDTLAAKWNLGWLRHRQGRYQEAAALFEETFEKYGRQLGPEQPVTLDSMSALGVAYTDLGRYDEAETIETDCLAIKRRVFGDDHLITFYSLTALAQVYTGQGRYDDAEPLLRGACEGRRRVLGAEHFETLQSMNGLAWNDYQRGRYEEARALSAEALDTARRALPEDHPVIAAAMNVQASALAGLGRNAAAAGIYEEILAIYRRTRGDEHPATLGAMNNLAIAYSLQGRDDASRPLFEEALEVSRRTRGEEHAVTLALMNALATSYTALYRVAEAETLYRQALAIQRRVLGDDHQSTLYTMQNLAVLLDGEGRFAEAAPLAGEALDGGRRSLGPDHPDSRLFAVVLAEIDGDLGLYREAERLCTAAREAMRADLGDDHPDALDAGRVLAGIRAGQGRYDEADRLYSETLAAQRRVLGEDHPSVSDTLYDRARLATLRGRRNDALSFLRRAVDGGWAQRRIVDEKAFASLRGASEFEAIVAEVRGRLDGEEEE